MVCKNCTGMLVLWAFSNGKCEKCGVDVVTSHIPCDKVCDSCSEQYEICKQCGEEKEDESATKLRIERYFNKLRGLLCCNTDEAEAAESGCYLFDESILETEKQYFIDCMYNNLSPYKALLFLTLDK